MAYDSAISSFTTKTDKVDLVQAAHINTVQSELVTIETILGTNVKGDRADLKTRLNNALDADGSILSGASYPSPALASQFFYRTDLDLVYVRNGSNTAWSQVGQSSSSTLFQYQGNAEQQGASEGEYTGTSLNPTAATGNYRFLQTDDTSFATVAVTKWVKLSGVQTVTVYCRIWCRSASTQQATVEVAIGAASGSVNGTANQTTPEWKSFTIDVSSLTNEVAYDVSIKLKNNTGGFEVFLSNLIAFGS